MPTKVTQLTLGWAVCVCVCVCVCARARARAHLVVSNSFVTQWTVARQAPLSMEFPVKTTMGCHFLLQGIFPTQGLKNLGRQVFYHWRHPERVN